MSRWLFIWSLLMLGLLALVWLPAWAGEADARDSCVPGAGAALKIEPGPSGTKEAAAAQGSLA